MLLKMISRVFIQKDVLCAKFKININRLHKICGAEDLSVFISPQQANYLAQIRKRSYNIIL